MELKGFIFYKYSIQKGIKNAPNKVINVLGLEHCKPTSFFREKQMIFHIFCIKGYFFVFSHKLLRVSQISADYDIITADYE
jgi:hypothetical protein